MSDGIELDSQMDLNQGDSQLEGLATLIRLECERSMESARNSVRHAIQAGHYLLAAKESVEHGQWMGWLEQHCHLSQRVANTYMRLARHGEEVLELNCESIREALRALSWVSLPPGEDVELEEEANWKHASILPPAQEPEDQSSNWKHASILEAQVSEEEPIDSTPSPEKKARIPNDFYETAEGLTRALLHRCPELNTSLILEPCAGDGAIARLFPDCTTNDVDPQRPCDYALDATDPYSWDEFEEVDWVVTNPPFSQAAQILPLAMDHARFGVAFLLRLTYLEPCSDRADWLLKHADQMRFCLPCNPRPQFRQDTDSTDSATVAWFIWLKDWSWTQLGLYPPFDFITNWR